VAGAIGIIFSVFEHSRPLELFRSEAQRLAKGQSDQLQPSKFRGVYRAIASDLNDGIEQVAAKGGVPRRAADLKQVLGDLPAEPQMSAFSLPGEGAAPPPPPSSPSSPRPMPSAPTNPRLPKPPPVPGRPAGPEPTSGEESASRKPAPPPRAGAAASEGNGAGASPATEESEWRKVYDDFVALKQQCGENVDGFTYTKFEQTLKKNRDALIQRHGAKRVRFSVYVKDGKAALKASPIKE
jgi:hypothetical protein